MINNQEGTQNPGASHWAAEGSYPTLDAETFKKSTRVLSPSNIWNSASNIWKQWCLYPRDYSCGKTWASVQIHLLQGPVQKTVLSKVPRLYIKEIQVLILKHWSEGQGPVNILSRNRGWVYTIFLIPFRFAKATGHHSFSLCSASECQYLLERRLHTHLLLWDFYTWWPNFHGSHTGDTLWPPISRDSGSAFLGLMGQYQ